MSARTLLALVVAILLASAPDADARKLQMSGTWAIRTGSQFVPLEFARSAGGPQRIFTSLGNLSKGFDIPDNAPIRGGGLVTATGGGPATLRLPLGRFRSSPSTLLPGWAPPLSSIIQITTMLVVDAPDATATLRPGGGPGSFQWCPDATLSCPVTGPPDGGTRNGRVIYRAGANRFGGTMQMALAGGGIWSFVFNWVPFHVGHAHAIGSGPTLRAMAVGRGTPSAPSTRMNYLAPFVVTQPTMVTATFSYIHIDPGPRPTTMFGVSTTGTGPTFRGPVIGTSAMGMSVSQSTTEVGFAHTTGTVIVQQTIGSSGSDFFTVMGSDARTPLGAGNISTVAGGISFRNTSWSQTPRASFHKVWLSLAPPVPSLSPEGAAAAGALLLLAVAYARRRRAGR